MARPTPATAVHLAPLLAPLWHGRPDAALPERRRAVQAHPPAPWAAWRTYRETHRAARIDARRRQRAGQPLGRGRMDNGGAQGIGARQQPPGRRWSPTGRQALGICTGVALNPQWAQLWCPQQAAA